VHHGGGLVTDDSRLPQAAQGRAHQEPVHRCDVVRQDTVHIGTAAQAPKISRPDKPSQLVIGPSAADGISAESKLGWRGGGIGHWPTLTRLLHPRTGLTQVGGQTRLLWTTSTGALFVLLGFCRTPVARTKLQKRAG
jgi:hypothetical protein